MNILETVSGQIPSAALYALVVGMIGVVVAVVVAAGRARTPRYAAQESLFSNAERMFFLVLDEALGSEYRVFTKVRLADLITPAGISGRKQWWNAFKRISSKHVDYVVVDRQRLGVVAVVELDDRSHQRADRRERDAFVNAAFAQAGIRLVRVPTRGRYNVADVRSQVLGLGEP